MVNIFTRYICLELTKVFLVTLTVMTLLMLLVGLVQEAVRENLTPWTIAQLIPFFIPNALCYAIPGTMLFSTCMVLGRMASANELVAVKSIGVSVMAALWPVIVFGFVLSLITVFVNDFAVSWGRQGAYRVVLRSVENTLYAVLNSQHGYQNGRISIFVNGVDGRKLVHPTVQIYGGGDSEMHTHFTADSAELSVDPEEDALVFSVRNALITHGDDINMVMPTGDFDIPLKDVVKKTDRSSTPSNLSLRVMQRETQMQQRQIQRQRRQLAMHAAFQMLRGDFISLTHPRWHSQLDELQSAQHRIFRLLTEPWRRWANGYSCLCFVLVGAPLAIYLKKSDFWNTFALCFIPILLIYYPLLMFGVGSAKSGDLAPPMVWLGNLVLILIGCTLIRRVNRN